MNLTTASTPRNRRARAFTILEVMIAVGIFFMCIFSILSLVSQGLANARALHRLDVDPSSALAELSLTNRLTEGPLPLEIVANFETMYPGYTISGEIYEVATNGLFQVDFLVGGSAEGRPVVTEHSVLLFRPQSQPGGFGRVRR